MPKVIKVSGKQLYCFARFGKHNLLVVSELAKISPIHASVDQLFYVDDNKLAMRQSVVVGASNSCFDNYALI